MMKNEQKRPRSFLAELPKYLLACWAGILLVEVVLALFEGGPLSAALWARLCRDPLLYAAVTAGAMVGCYIRCRKSRAGTADDG